MVEELFILYSVCNREEMGRRRSKVWLGREGEKITQGLGMALIP